MQLSPARNSDIKRLAQWYREMTWGRYVFGESIKKTLYWFLSFLNLMIHFLRS